MKTIQLFFVMFFCIAASSCAHYSDGTPVWSDGLWVIPTLFFIGVVIFGRKTYLGWKSGSEVYNKKTGKWSDDGKKMIPVGYMVFTIACIIGAIASIIMIVSDK